MIFRDFLAFDFEDETYQSVIFDIEERCTEGFIRLNQAILETNYY